MKVRSSFVSNSSTASFMIAVPSTDKSKTIITLEVDIKDYADHAIETIEELKEYFEKDYYWEEIEAEGKLMEEFNQAKKAIEEGKVVLVGSLSDRAICNPMEAVLLCNGFPEDNPDLTIIQNTYGY